MCISYYEKIGGEVKCIDYEIPFDLPDGWAWSRLNSVAIVIMGSSPQGISIVTDSTYMEFHQGKIHFSDNVIGYSGQYTTEVTKIAPANSVLLCVRAPVGEVNLTDRDICIGRGLAAVKSLCDISEYFLFYWLQTLKKKLIDKGTGSTFVAVTTDDVKSLLLPIPPIKMQNRIICQLQKSKEILNMIT